MNNSFAAFFFFIVSMFSTVVFAQDEGAAQPTIPKEFESLKQLIGTWEGKNLMGDEEVNMKVSYALTSAGTAITETLMQGTPQEMISVYHKDGDSVAMTHYCTLGNQPHMKLIEASDSEMAFQMQGVAGIKSKNESHMHAVTLKFIDNNTLEQHWVHHVDGKPMGAPTVFSFKRKS